MPFLSRSAALQEFRKLLTEASERYGYTDMNGASLDHCKIFGHYEVKHGFFIQLYETQLDQTETINWPDISNWR